MTPLAVIDMRVTPALLMRLCDLHARYLRRQRDGRRTVLRGCHLSDLDLSGCDLASGQLAAAALAHAVLKRANLRGASLRDAAFDGAKFGEPPGTGLWTRWPDTSLDPGSEL